ncbi:MAG: APC family permease [Promethearchaeota archaeon]
MEEQEPEFHKHLSKFSCLMIGIGGLIGGGIFSVIGVISAFTGPYSYLSYVITGIVALITVYSYQKLTLKWGDPGGEYTCVQNAFYNSKLQNLGPFIGILLFFGYIVTMALYAYTFSIYFILMFNVRYSFYLIAIIIVVLIFILMILNLKGVKESARVQGILVIVYSCIFLIFIILGISFTMQNPERMITNVGLDGKSITNINIIGIVLGSSCILISYEGFQLIAYGSHEMDDKEGGLKMMKWAVIFAMIIYYLVGFTTMAVLGVSEIISEDAHNAEVSIALAALISIGILGMFLIIFGALLSTTSALNATMLGSSRLAYMMAKDEVLPQKISKINKNKVPFISIITTGIISIILALFTGGALAIAGLAGLIFAQIFFIINLTNFKVRKVTGSNAILPITGMILTSSFFSILLFYSFINFDQEIYSLLSFFIMEAATIFFVFHIKRRNGNLKNKN